jgi:hypothetical protein
MKVRKKESIEIELSDDVLQELRRVCSETGATIDEIIEQALLDAISETITASALLSMSDDELLVLLSRYVVVTDDDGSPLCRIVPVHEEIADGEEDCSEADNSEEA